MKNYAMRITYDGTNYYGWQRLNDLPSIQGTIEKALKKLLGETILIHGAGRTDSGVHSLKGQMASFSIQTNIAPEKLKYAINRVLPSSIYIEDIYDMPLNFHARYSAIGKRYTYEIYKGHRSNPFNNNYAHHVKYNLDLNEMKNAIPYFVGTHDFSAFMASGSKIEDALRTVYTFEMEEQNEKVKFHIYGNGFLYNMIRIIMGTLIDVGQGKIQSDEIPEIIKSLERSKARVTAPACGLYLTEVCYPTEYLKIINKTN